MAASDYVGTQVGADGQRHTVASPDLAIVANADTLVVAAAGATEALDTSAYDMFDVTMNQACTFSFINPNAKGNKTVIELLLRAGATEEVQLITETGSGLTSWVGHYAGQDTASILQAATAAQVQAAFIALSNLAPGDLVVTGAPGAYTFTFGGTLANTNVAAITTTPTGGTGAMVVTTPTPGDVDFDPTWPASVDWTDGAEPTFAAPALYCFLTVDAGVTWLGMQKGKAFA